MALNGGFGEEEMRHADGESLNEQPLIERLNLRVAKLEAFELFNFLTQNSNHLSGGQSAGHHQFKFISDNQRRRNNKIIRNDNCVFKRFIGVSNRQHRIGGQQHAAATLTGPLAGQFLGLSLRALQERSAVTGSIKLSELIGLQIKN